MEHGIFNMQKVSEVNYIVFGHNLLELVSFKKKKTLHICLHPGISLIDRNSILIELPGERLAVKLLFSPADMWQRIIIVHPELLQGQKDKQNSSN